MEPPIIAWEPNDMTVFSTLEEAEAYLEPWMCESMSIFDRTGRRLVFEDRGWRNNLREIEPGKTHEAELRKALLQFLSAVTSQGDLSGRSTDELIRLATPLAGVSKPRFGVLPGFVIDLVRWLLGKEPLAARFRARRQPPTT
jgi:hypothetical protein